MELRGSDRASFYLTPCLSIFTQRGFKARTNLLRTEEKVKKNRREDSGIQIFSRKKLISCNSNIFHLELRSRSNSEEIGKIKVSPIRTE